MSNKVAPIPEGYNSITPYMFVNDGTKAIDYYKQAFDAEEVMCMKDPDGKVAHAELKVGDSKIMLADEYPEMGARGPEAYGGSPIALHLYVKDVDAVAKKAVDAGGTLTKPVENAFYGDRNGAVRDPFGHTWYISTHIEDVSEEEMRKRAAQQFNHK